MSRLSPDSGLSSDDQATFAELRLALERGGGSQQPIEELRREGLISEAWHLLCTALRDSKSWFRAEACLALDYLNDPAAIADLRPMLADSDAMVSVRAADALCRFGEPATALVPRLIEVLRQPEAELPLGSNRYLPPCMYLAMPEARYHAARILGYLGPDGAPAREELRSSLKSASAMVRAEAAKTLAGIGEPPEVYLAPLRQALGDAIVQSSRERVRTAETLLELGEPPELVISELAGFVDDDDWTAACWAMQQLGQLGCAATSAVPTLRVALGSVRPGVAEEAAAALRQIEVSVPR